ncbi:MAG: hypothetical protein IJM91_02930 [Lachnospiraceae bacterium]|nr:hypothetical protein [Lachnospiraceae bacterium]
MKQLWVVGSPNVGINVGTNVGINKTEKAVLGLLINNPEMTGEEIAIEVELQREL